MNLYAKFSRPPRGTTNAPICIIMHGYNETALSILDATITRIADYGLFVVAVAMRGRDGSGGTADDSARDCYDIYDVLAYVRSHYASIVHPTYAVLTGYSGGGGNALAMACKFPDTFPVLADHFGISDYGRDATNSWYQNNGNPASYCPTLAARIGDTPTNVPDNYYARDATAAILNYSGGHLYIYHDTADTSVPVIHSQRIDTILSGASRTNYTYTQTTVGDANRATHGLPQGANASLAWTEAEWAAAAAAMTHAEWTMPASGTITVIGYIVTKRFTIWLNTGLDAAATVVYDTVAGTYTVTPLTSNAVVAVTITQGELTASGNTNGETLFTVA